VGVIVLACLVTFGPILANGFVSWDDYETISRNARVTSPSVGNLLYYWRNPHMHLYAPLTYTIWMTLAGVARMVGDGGPLPASLFHGASLVLHVLSSLVVYALLRRLVAQPIAALLGALLFALHPVQLEPVAWTSGLKDVLCGLLIWTAVWQYHRFATDGSKGAYALALTTFVLGMLAKPTAMVTPLILLVMDLWVVRRGVRKAMVALLPWLLLTVASAVWTAKSQPPSDVVPKVAPALRPLVATDALAIYLYKLFVPLNLTFDPGRRPDWVVARGYVWYTWLVPVAALMLLAWAWRRFNRRDGFAATLLVFAAIVPLICLAPVLRLRSFDFQQYSTVAEHYLYPAMVGPALLAAVFLGARVARPDKRAATVGVASVVLALLAVVSHVQTYYWKDNLTLFTHAVDVNPNSYAALNSLAATYVETGQADRAIEPARRAVELRPSYARYYLTLGNALGATNRLDEAKAAYRQAIALAPEEPSAHSNLAGVLARSGDLNAAEAEVREALRLDPQDAQAHLNLGTMYAQGGRNEDAISELEASLQLNPNSAIAHANLGFVLLSAGKPSDAATHFVAALKLNPNYAQARNGLAQAQGMMRAGRGGGG